MQFIFVVLLSYSAQGQIPSSTPCAENKDPLAQCGIELPNTALHLCIGEKCFDITESRSTPPQYRWTRHIPGQPSESGKIGYKDYISLKKAAADFATWSTKNTPKKAAAVSSSTLSTAPPVCTLPLNMEITQEGGVKVTRDICRDELPKGPAEERAQALLRLFNTPKLLTK